MLIGRNVAVAAHRIAVHVESSHIALPTIHTP